MVTPKDFFHRLTKIKNYITNPHDNIEVRNERLIELWYNMLISTDGVKTLINLYVNGVFAPHV